MKLFVLIFFTTLLAACSSGDSEMCACLESGQKLNDYSAKLMSGSITKEKALELKKLREEKKKKCKSFENMSGEEMMKKAEGCEFMPKQETED